MGKILAAEKLLLGNPPGQIILEKDNRTGAPKITVAGVSRVLSADVVYCKYKRCTLVEVKAGVTIVAGVAGYKIRPVQCGFTAIGGAGATADGVKLLGTVAGSSANLATVLIAALVENAYHQIGFTNETPTLWVAPAAAGLTFAGCDVGTAVTCKSYGIGVLDTLVSLDVVFSYCLDAA